MELLRVAGHAPVTLHIYDVVDHTAVVAANKVLRMFGSGAFHVGIEVFGREWSYGGLPAGSTNSAEMTGVGFNEPRSCSFGRYKESVYLGRTNISEAAFHQIIEVMQKEWPGYAYDVLSFNCCGFC